MGHYFFFPDHITKATDKEIEEMQKTLEKIYGREFSFEESQKALEDLERLCIIVVRQVLKESAIQTD